MPRSDDPVAAYSAGRPLPLAPALIRQMRTGTEQVTQHSIGRRSGFHGIIPSYLRPLVRAYLLGYASSVAPRIINAVLAYFAACRRQRRGDSPRRAAELSLARLRDSIRHVLRSGLELHRFPTFCAALVGGSTLFTSKQTTAFNGSVATKATNDTTGKANATARNRPNTALAATQDAALTTAAVPCAGRTLDLTLFAVTRALDVVVGELWARRRQRKVAAGSWTGLEALVGRLTDSAIFASSSALVMWAWFYVPSRLPHAYNKWITSAAAVDARLIDALRLCRAGQLQYGKDTGPRARLLQGMAHDYKWPLRWGDPAVTVPFPCTMVHMDCGPSCEYHALVRFLRSWRWSVATYLPLSLLLVLRRPNRNLRGIRQAVLSAMRSSVFLATFITLFFYGVCLARSRIGPLVLGKSVAARQAIDSGLCTAVGCGLCGWSILIEPASRRKDMGLFVAPRALATLFPRRYALDKQWRETLVFAASSAIVFTASQENPKRVRGVLGKILKFVLVP
ncbi:hypothetical protein SEPCBS119000_001755 [Sporothrix epigloea]|uniref:Integral membrane protein n=1 Tax=Sporothrix epigloea TaxID=1892477 RepID=A0ABP0DFI1_9PEZI